MDKKPRVARMVMFKHGVAYLERSGPAEASFELSFRKDEMNDVLKSLAVWVAEGDAKLTSVAFDAPEDPDVALAERGLLLGFGSALDSLVQSLRGRTVEVDDGSGRAKGQVLGVQHHQGPNGERRASLLLRSSEGSVTVYDLQSVRGLHLLEGVSRERLEFVVARSQAATAGETRTVKVVIEGKAKDLRAAYVIPAPVWRVSYRVVRDAQGAVVMAMGIIHNPVDEDLEDVELTLTTGQPVSFMIDLYHPKKVERVVVEEETRAGAAPTRFERTRAMAPPAPGFGPPPAPGAFDALESAPMMRGAPAPASGFGGAAAFDTGADASEGVDRGEFFEYRVASKLSLRRGGSAMVPLAATRVPAKRERIWRDGTGPNPDLVLGFKNETGLVLEEGPAVIYDEGVYAGESMLPYSARGVDVKMAFAKDLGVRVVRRSQSATVIASVRLDQAGLLEEQRQEETHTVDVESDHEEAVEVIVELSKIAGRDSAPGSAKPFEETLNYRRFKVEVAPHAKAQLVVKEVWPAWRRVAVQSLSTWELSRWFQDKHLDEATFNKLSGVLARWAEAKSLEEQKRRVEAEQAQAYAKQSKISEQLNVLKETGPEGALRLRYVKELEAEQDKVNAAEAESRRLAQAIADTRKLAEQELAALVAGK